MRKLWLLVCLSAGLWAQTDARRVASPSAGQRVALVIGNGAYDWRPLVNPINDARDVSDALKQAGFTSSNVTTVLNANNVQLRRSIREFVESVRPGDFTFLYYSGHGIEIRGENYLLPVDLPSNATEILVQDEAVSAQRILNDLSHQGARVKVLILDACRDNPLRATKSTAGGLAPMEGKGSLVVFATEAGKTASDAPQQRNGLFTQYLLEGLHQRGVSLDEAMKLVSRNVAKATHEQQVPAIYGLLLEDFVLLSASAEAPSPELAKPPKESGVQDGKIGAPANEDGAAFLKKEAEAGNAKAQAELGAWYALGMIVPKNIPEALKWLRMAADKGNPQAQYNLALMYSKGQGVPVDQNLSRQMLTKAAEQGHPDAQYYMGQMYREGDDSTKPDPAKARAWYLKAAEQGHADAQSNLGAMYHEGWGGAKDNEQAVKWMAKAAEQGDAGAQHNMGLFYRNGDGVPKDYGKSLEWFRKSADQGYAKGQDQVGNAYAFGWGVPLNWEEAVTWYRKAAAQGEPQAEYNLAICYIKGNGGLEQDYKQALLWLQRAADHGSKDAQVMLAKLVN